MVGMQKRTRRVMVRPIVDWTEKDVWNYIRAHNLPYPSLYDEGFSRLGCIGCPLASRANREKEYKRWPYFEKKWTELARNIYNARAWSDFPNFEKFYECWMDHKF